MTTLSIAMGLVVLDSVIAGVAVPSIAADLDISPTQSVWIISTYLIATAAALLPFSSLGDIKGHRFVYLLGLAIFTAASFACALSTSLPMLLIARMVQGIGAAGVASVNMALVRYIYPPSQLGRGMGLIGLVVATAAAAGPSAGTALLEIAPWPYIFLLSAPFGCLAFLLAVTSLPATPGSGRDFDLISTVLNMLGFSLILIGAEGLGHGRSGSFVFLTSGLLFMTVLVRRQKSREAPMLPVDLLRTPTIAASAATSICAYICQTLAFLALVFYFQVVGGQSLIDVGLLMTPWPAALMVAAPIAGRLADRYSAGTLCGIGLGALTIGMALVAQIPADATFSEAVWPFLLCGAGFGLFQSANNRAFMSAAPRARSGACAGLMTTSRLTGQTIGGLILGLVFAITDTEQSFIGRSVDIALINSACFAAIATGVSVFRVRADRRRSRASIVRNST